VDRAIDIVELALQVCPPPVYVRKEIVHNRHVVEALRAKGAHFVDELDEVPDNATVIFSAHGISPAVRQEAQAGAARDRRHVPAGDQGAPRGRALRARGLLDHPGGSRRPRRGGGTMGEAPDRMFVIAHPDEVERLVVPDPDKVAFLTQTTLSVDDTRDCIGALRKRFPKIVGPSKDDICYATQNRQARLKTVASEVDVLLVIGAANSSNANRWSRCPRGWAPRPTSSTTRTTFGRSGSRGPRAWE
jgi:4-hydroxy-3-methylbut-2-enyl diphosphate reductase